MARSSLAWAATLLVVAACGGTGPGGGSGGAANDDGSSSGGETSTDGSTGGAAPSGGATQGDGGSSSDGGPTGGASPGDGGTTFTGGMGGLGGTGGGPGPVDYELCGPEPQMLVGPVIEPMVLLDQPAPVPMGGALVDGTYDLVSSIFYEEFPVENLSDDFRQVVRVRGGGTRIDVLHTEQHPEGSMLRESSVSVAPIVPGSTSMTLTMECPADVAGGTGPQPYTATPSELTFFIDYSTATVVNTHVLRQ